MSKLVQLTAWRDGLFGLTDEGQIVRLDFSDAPPYDFRATLVFPGLPLDLA